MGQLERVLTKKPHQPFDIIQFIAQIQMEQRYE